MAPSTLDYLKEYTTVVIDTGDFQAIKDLKPQDATTNPSLLLQAAKMKEYESLVNEVIQKAKADFGKDGVDSSVEKAMDLLLVKFGTEILKLVPGRVSTEVDAAFSYNKEKTIEKAKRIIEMYKAEGIDKDRVLIKIASTFEGIQAAKELEAEGIHCNLTLLFSMAQAIACAEAKVTLISPFVGRILDYYKKETGKEYEAHEDPGVVSVKEIYTYYKQNGVATIVMGASFRNSGEIKELCGCDFLTISPALLDELSKSDEKLTPKLSKELALKQEKLEVKSYINDKEAFEEALKSNKMAASKLPEGIKKFKEDAEALKIFLKSLY